MRARDDAGTIARMDVRAVRVGLVTLLAAGLGIGAFAALRTGAYRVQSADALADVLAGWALIGAGVIAWLRRPGSRAALLVGAVGVVWLAADVRFVEAAATNTAGELLRGTYWLILAVLLVTFPTGDAETRLERVTVTFIIVFAVPNAIGTLPFDPARDCPRCEENLLSIDPDPALADAMAVVLAACSAVVAVLTMTCVTLRWRRASAARRRAFTPVLLAGVVVFAIVVAALVSGGPVEETLPEWAKALAMLVLAAGLLAGLLRTWLDRAAVGRLVVELGAATTPERLREALARALHDPTVELHLDPDAPAPAPGPGRAVTELRGHGALVHDPAVLDDPALIDAVSEAARLAVENERLQAAVRAQVEELHASRQRIAEAGISERRRVERDLHDGAQQRLVTLSLALGMAQQRAAASADPELQALLREVREDLSTALHELRELARGIHPALLVEAGLRPALEALAARAPVPTRVLSAPDGRLPPAVEATAYFVASESLANIGKHARAHSATIAARRVDGEAVVEITDDGVGGATVTRGSGLAGLRDRVGALGGDLTVEAPDDGGTRIVAHIPCE
jgi:signal transduction histidine kinase